MKEKINPYAHQTECLDRSWDLPFFAILLEQGLGKTKVALDTAVLLNKHRRVNRMLVLAPNGVHSNWIRREIPKHMPNNVLLTALEWDGGHTKRFDKEFDALCNSHGLAIFAMNIEALSSSGGRGYAAAETFLRSGAGYSLMVVDESSRIKTPSATRTKNVIKLGRLAEYRRILTGTPVTQSPFDLYSQFSFLKRGCLGFTSFGAFKCQYGIWKSEQGYRDGRTWQYKVLVNYVRLPDLIERVAPYSFRRTKPECLDLPEKIYVRMPVQLGKKARAAYNQMLEEGELVFDDFESLAPLQITRLLRCQQITGGFLPTGRIVGQEVEYVEPFDESNPKMATLLDLTDDVYVGKTIIWARFRHEIAMIAASLRGRLPVSKDTVVELHGGVSREDRQKAIDSFQDPDGARFLVGQQAAGIGITLTAAEYVFYYSNSFSSDERRQTEDRVHRIGLHHPVVYIDLEAVGTVDERIREVLKSSADMASFITEGIREKEGTGG